ncbi:DUF3794 domain-containing protein [Paludicola sp. MB14-C6]|uniref:DUF3794 and LysM peptidoglycan-binding domain-containing protein n=1 Tax=Paludihabitans sp. MB14-C6 TaxID=3070656 RepID=UPI0027DCBF7E|nr:SPOCS domain-containing protein [Paludicola sp. MB14-C6]WMJ23704.1 DUF3794 domain-containing protein [Paludicola sp. MB14-C6]
MELKLTHESICINEVVFDGVLEQPIELDYLLPDYCQSIFKVLKCKITPKITSQRIMNGKLLIDGVAYIKIIYVSEECYRVKSIMQKQVFSKSMDLKDAFDNGTVNVYCKCDYVNCRVVNQHRLDIRGAVSMKAIIICPKKIDILSKAEGMGVQIDNKKVTALGEKLAANKEFSIKEEMELGYGKPGIVNILDNTANAVLSDYKLIQNKVILKGEILLHLLYSSENEDKPEIMDYNIPISQIVDVAGINDEYKCVISFDVTNVDINLKSSGENASTSFDAEFVVRANLEANKNEEMKLINDIYSTDFNVQTNASNIKVAQLICVVNEIAVCKNAVKISKNEVNCIYDIVCDFTNESAKFNDGFLEVCGNLNISILAMDSENMPIMIDKTVPCEMKLECKCGGPDVMFVPNVTISSVSYNLTAADEIEVRVELKICGNVYKYTFYDVVSSIAIDENNKKEIKDDAVLRLYFASSGEMIWDIAKKFNTSVDAVMLENNLNDDVLHSNGMLLIPIIH